MFGEKMIRAGMFFAGVVFVGGIVMLALDVGVGQSRSEFYRQTVSALGGCGILVSAGAIWFWVSKRVPKPTSFGEALSAAGLILGCIVFVFVITVLYAGADASDPESFRLVMGAFGLAGILALAGAIWSMVSK